MFRSEVEILAEHGDDKAISYVMGVPVEAFSNTHYRLGRRTNATVSALKDNIARNGVTNMSLNEINSKLILLTHQLSLFEQLYLRENMN